MKPKFKKLPSNKRLNELLRYNPQTGELRWKTNRRGTAKAGQLAGVIDKPHGYVKVCIDNVRYKAHRICYKMATGWDVGIFEIDHINGVRSDNRLSNLRMVDALTNRKNTKRRSDNTSGYTGVYFIKRSKKWRAQLKVNGKKVHLGCFEKLEDAVAVRAAADVKHGFHVNHGRAA
jgi:hypothetical protein